jgi:uncharacterized membrane protein
MRAALVASVVLLAAMAGISAFGFAVIPPGAMLATHWGLSGEADGFTARGPALISLPLMAAFTAAVCAAVPFLEPRRQHAPQNRGLLFAGWIGSLALLAAVHAGVVLAATGDLGPNAPVSVASVAAPLLLLAIGNYTAKTRSNFFLGVRTPWTLSSEHAWRVANRTAGWALVLTGLLGLAAAVFLDPAASFVVCVAGSLSAAAVSMAASWLAWRADSGENDA